MYWKTFLNILVYKKQNSELANMTCFRNNHSPGKLKHKRLKSQIIKSLLDHLLKVEKTHESCFVFHFVFRKRPLCSCLISTFTWLSFLFQLITMKSVTVLLSCVLLISLLNVQPSHSMSCSYCVQQARTCNNNCYQMLSNIIGNIGRKRRSFSCYNICTMMHQSCSKHCT